MDLFMIIELICMLWAMLLWAVKPPMKDDEAAKELQLTKNQEFNPESILSHERSTERMDAVVKVFCVHAKSNLSLPWQRKRQSSSSSSGFVIDGRRILTNAQAVEHHTQVKVKKRGSDTNYLATVLAIGTECDIAMLTVSSEEFWEGITPVQFGCLPSLQDAVTVMGYAIGGDTISVTSGVVSRIEVTAYFHSAAQLLGVQIDAAINSGNYGGPAFNDKGQCVGIAFQSLMDNAQNIGYLIPTLIIEHFITDYEQTGQFTGFPVAGFEWQKMESPELRRALGMELHQKGVRIRTTSSAVASCLQPSDVLLSFDGIDIANDGTVPFHHGDRIAFSYLVSQKYCGERAKVKVLRNKMVQEFDLELLLLVGHKKVNPSYYIVAGIVFVSLSASYLRSEYGKEYKQNPLYGKLFTGRQVVVISQVLAADVNVGYENIVNTEVLAFNGVPVDNLKHLASMVDSCEEPFLRFDLEDHEVMVLDAAAAKAATGPILATHCIPSASSDDLRAVEGQP